MSTLTQIDEDFWDRESLKAIRNAALARMASPWAVLGIAAMRALALVSPEAKLPPLVGGYGSLNSFVALVGESGAGKGAATAVAEELVPFDRFVIPPVVVDVGSGEGMVDVFNRGVEDETEWIRSVVFDVTEIDAWSSQKSRAGSTDTVVLRKAWSGEELGFTTKAAKGAKVKKHSYRATGYFSVQPARARALFEAGDGGLPQRFLWFPATDDSIDRTKFSARLIDPLELPPLAELEKVRTIEVCDWARDVIQTAHENKQRGIPGLDGHTLFAQEKFAVALAVLDGRVEITEEDWDLAGMVEEVSNRTRESIARELFEAERLEAERRGELDAARREAAKVAEAEREELLKHRCALKILAILDDHRDGIGTGQLKNKLSKPQRRFAADAFLSLSNQGFAEGRPAKQGGNRCFITPEGSTWLNQNEDKFTSKYFGDD